ncbi:glutamate receptor 1-like [Haliotis asinina]|uniref:glutamate receptor 1-like n=1 Tax=Haliotis asinina TaxID=109174 RepID=UPI003531A42D
MKTDTTRSFYLVAKPLQVVVYVTFAAAIGGLFIVFILVENHNSIFTAKCDGTSKVFIRQLPIICWQFIGSVFRQGFQTEPRTYAGKILLSSSWLLVIVVSSVYSANLMAVLTAGTGMIKLSSISDLVDSDYTVGMYNIGISTHIMKTSQRPDIRRLYDKMKTLSAHDTGIFLNDQEKHMARVKQGTHAYIAYRSFAEQRMARDCHLALVGEPVSWANELLAFATPKGYPLKSDIEKVMRQLKESGIMDLWWKQRVANDSDSSCGIDRTVKTITLQDVLGGFLVVCGGIGLSCVMLILELCRHQVHNTNSSQAVYWPIPEKFKSILFQDALDMFRVVPWRNLRVKATDMAETTVEAASSLCQGMASTDKVLDSHCEFTTQSTLRVNILLSILLMQRFLTGTSCGLNWLTWHKMFKPPEVISEILFRQHMEQLKILWRFTTSTYPSIDLIPKVFNWIQIRGSGGPGTGIDVLIGQVEKTKRNKFVQMSHGARPPPFKRIYTEIDQRLTRLKDQLATGLKTPMEFLSADGHLIKMDT